MKRTVIYARVSTEDQVEKYGLPSQLRACREYAAAHGLEIIAEVSDEGITGTTMDRPGLERVLKMVRDGLIDVVLCYDTDRLSRVLGHLLVIKPEIDKRARVEFVASKFEDSPSGQLFLSIRGAVAEYERSNTLLRLMRGKKERARAGLIVGGRTAYGYQYAEGKLTPDPDRAPIVRRIFESFTAGQSIRGIARELREIAAPTWSGRKWGHTSVRRILTNETFAGVAYFGTHRRVGAQLKLRNPQERIALPVTAIVTREQWEAAQTILRENPAQVGKPSTAYLLRGVLYCVCGKRMGGEFSRKCRAYRCSGRDAMRHTGVGCTRRVSVPKLDAAVWQSVLDVFTDAARLRGILAEYQAELRDQVPDRSEALARQVRGLRGKEDRCLSLMLDTDMAGDIATLKRRYLEAQRARQSAEAELSRIAAVHRQVENAGAWIERVANVLRENLLTMTDPAARQGFIRGLVSRAQWDGSMSVKLDCFLGAEMDTTCSRSVLFGAGQLPQSKGLHFSLTARLAA